MFFTNAFGCTRIAFSYNIYDIRCVYHFWFACVFSMGYFSSPSESRVHWERHHIHGTVCVGVAAVVYIYLPPPHLTYIAY